MLAVVLLSATTMASAQSRPEADGKHFISLQANPLISQIFNFGNPIPISNPYLIKYSYRFAGGNSGITTGIGYRAISNESEQDGFESKFSGLDLRVGYEWYIDMGDRFLLSVGPDLTFNGQTNKTVSVSAINFGSGFRDSTVNDTYSQNLSYGGGARLNFSVAITPKLLIGTEATFYYSFTRSKSTTRIERFIIENNNENYSFEKHKDEQTGTFTRIQLPVAIFLTFNF